MKPAQHFWVICSEVRIFSWWKGFLLYPASTFPISFHFMTTVLFYDHAPQWRAWLLLLSNFFVRGKTQVGPSRFSFLFPRLDKSSSLSLISRNKCCHPKHIGHPLLSSVCCSTPLCLGTQNWTWYLPGSLTSEEEWNDIVINRSKFEETVVENIFSPLWFNI